MNDKINLLMKKMEKENVDVAFFDNPHTVSFLTGYRSEPHERILAALLLKSGSALLFTPALEMEDAKNTVSGWEVFSYLDTEDPWQIIKEKLEKSAVVPQYWAAEKNYLTVLRKESLEAVFPGSSFQNDFSAEIENLKLQKNKGEIKKMKEAGYWADEAIKMGVKVLREGITELEVVAEIEYGLKKSGIKQMSFDTMVLFGENAASPHGEPGTRKLKKNQFVLFDLGVMCNGYASDVTRTLFFGEQPTSHQKEIYELVLSAHDQAMRSARIGMSAEELDKTARKIIAEKGYGDYFNHRLGHGLGQSVHEYPSIMEGNKMKLAENMCFSIEPGIYLPGDIGVRIEDCGYLDETGFHPFTSFPTSITAYQDFLTGKN